MNHKQESNLFEDADIHQQQPPEDLDLRSKSREAPLTPQTGRFHIFLIDTGWNGPVSKAVRTHIPLLYQYNRQDTLYILTPEQSVEVLKHVPETIGHDPIVAIYDKYGSHGRGKKSRNYHGFRLNLGLIKHPEQALARLQEFVRFVSMNRTADCLDAEVKRALHREGLQGMVKILREASTELL
jgi:hypothetical protein